MQKMMGLSEDVFQTVTSVDLAGRAQAVKDYCCTVGDYYGCDYYSRIRETSEKCFTSLMDPQNYDLLKRIIS